MGRSGTGVGFLPSQTSTSMPGGFDEEQMAIARKRLMLQQLANEAPMDSGYKGSHWVNPYLGQLGSALTGAFAQNEQTGLDAQAADVAQRRSAAQQQAISEMPMDTPGTPGSPAINAGMPQPGMEGPPTPDTLTTAPYAVPPDDTASMVPRPVHDFTAAMAASPMLPATPRDWGVWAAKNAGISPMMADVGKKGLENAMLAPEKARLAAEAAQARKDLAAQNAEARASEKENQRIETARLSEYRAADREREATARAADRADQIRLAAELRAAAGGGEKGSMVDAGWSDAGNPVVANTKSGIRHEVINGVPSPTPYAGAITPKVDQTKAVAAAGTGAKSIADMQAALDAVTENPGLYSPRTAVSSKLPSFAGIGAAASGLNESELAQRSNIASMTADTTHSLYGSAFSAGEQKQAKEFLVDPGDSAVSVKAKLAGRIKLEQEHFNNLPASAKAAYESRKGGAAGKTVARTGTNSKGQKVIEYTDGTREVK